MNCLYCASDKHIIKSGIRQTQEGIIQKYYCRHCKKYYTNKTQPYIHYPLHVILYTLQQYNKGYPVKKAKTLTGKKYRYSPPLRTIYSWIDKYQNTLTFLKLRKQHTVDPSNLVSIHRFYHQQIYPFTYHHLKLNLNSKQFPQLRRYINWVERSLPTKIFLTGPRASQCSTCKKIKAKTKRSIAPELTRLALNLQGKNQSAHEAVEQFFLYNDSTTICTELPVFLNPKETTEFNIETPLTGHIDIIQIRNNKVYIMDYKPNLNHPEKYAGQLMAYKQALHHRTQISEDNIITSVFNEYHYYEFKTQNTLQMEKQKLDNNTNLH
jgi:transposase-like protein